MSPTDYQTQRLSLKAHPMKRCCGRWFRCRQGRHTQRKSPPCRTVKNGAHVRVGGIVLVRQRPGKGNAIFITLEDETGIVNVVLWARQFEHFRREVMAARLMGVEGRVQKSPEGVVHLMAQQIFDRSSALDRLFAEEATTTPERMIPAANDHPPPRARHPRDARILPRSRDFR